MAIKVGQRWLYTLTSVNIRYIIEVENIVDDYFVRCKYLWSSDPVYRCGHVSSFGHMPRESNEYISSNGSYSYILLEGQDRP